MKKFFKRISPSAAKLREFKYLRFLGEHIYDRSLWSFNRRCTAWAVSIGFFCMYLPLPFQMVFACILALIIRANLPLSVVLVWISNPITMPPMFYFAYKLGVIILGIPPRPFTIELSFHWLFTQLGYIWHPLLLGSMICGITLAIIGHIAIRLWWRILIINTWRNRHRQVKK